MIDQIIKDAVRTLLKTGLLQRNKEQAAITALQATFKNRRAVIWNTDDIHASANRMGFSLTEEDAGLVLDYVSCDHDANNGISWDEIESGIRELFPDHKANEDCHALTNKEVQKHLDTGVCFVYSKRLKRNTER